MGLAALHLPDSFQHNGLPRRRLASGHRIIANVVYHGMSHTGGSFIPVHYGHENLIRGAIPSLKTIVGLLVIP